MATAAVSTQERAPRLVFVYTWDIIRAVGAVIAAFSAFAGGYEVGTRNVSLPIWEQIIGGLSSAGYAAALIVTATLLSRRQQWVRRAQLWLLAISAVLIVVSIIPASASAPLSALIAGASGFLLLDFAAIWSLTRSDAPRWYTVPGAIPKYIIGCMALWVAGSVALLVLPVPQ